MSMQKERWKQIKNSSNHYISSHGRLKSVDSIVKHSTGADKINRGRIMKISVCGNNYKMIAYSYKGQRYTELIHRLVAQAFIPNPENKPQVNHKDGDKLNNNVDNLEWCTRSENQLHSFRVLGTKPNKTGLGKIGILNASSKRVAEIDDSGKILKVWASATEANNEIGSTPNKVSAVCRGVYKKTRGRKFRYITHKEFTKYRLIK